MTNTLVTRAGGGIDDAALEAFVAGFTGQVITPDGADYDDARHVFNGMIDRRPGLIVRPANTQDVQDAVNFARDQGLLVSVNGGGHSVQGYGVCEGGLMIDLIMLKDIVVDPNTRTATAEGGVTWGEFDAATQAHGLAVTGGRITSTGIGGLTLGSGSGWLERKLGYTVDNLIGAEVVTASGEVLHASETENAELFWGLRGGGGNFGVVTKFEYRLHPIGPIIFGGLLAWPRFMAKDVLTVYRGFIEDAPDDIGGAAALLTAPPAPFVPPEVQGQRILAVVVLYTGDPADGERAFEPILSLNPALRMVGPMPYVELQKLLDAANQPGMQNYWKAPMFEALPDEAVEALLSTSDNCPSPLTTIIIQPLGGAARRVPDDATAMGWRRARWAMDMLGMWPDPSQNDLNIAWIRNLASVMEQWSLDGTYLNYLMDEGEQKVKDSFGGHYGRMVALKNQYDPTNLFSLNQNIKPTV
jgi:FAD/FMN-containing dehydrogenase